MKYSVISVCKNSANAVKKTIKSVISQWLPIYCPRQWTLWILTVLRARHASIWGAVPILWTVGLPLEALAKVGSIYIMDATQAFPFVDSQLDYIYCEDFIEHFDQKDGLSIFSECYRVLKPGWVWRMSTPSFDHILTFFEMNARDAINFDHWQWGHKLLYTESYARKIMDRCGFHEVECCEFSKSRFGALRGIDSREQQKDWSLILDEFKP